MNENMIKKEALSFIGGGTADKKLIKSFLNNRIIIFNEDVEDCIIEDLMLYILKWNEEDKDIPVDNRKKIKIYFNSYGGDAHIAGAFCSLVEVSRTPIMAVALGTVASAAYHMYIACQERVAFENSIFLQHEGEMSMEDSSSKLRDRINFYDIMEKKFKNNVLENTKMDEKFYDDIYKVEFWIYSDRAKELGIVDKIIGQDCTIDYIF